MGFAQGEEKMTTIARIKEKGTITINDDISFRLIVEALNGLFNCGYRGYQSSSWFPKGKKDERFAWFPKFSLANGQPVAVEWDNYFFDTENYICERRMLTKAAEIEICKGNPSHYNNPLDCIKSGKPIPTLAPKKCQFADNNFEWHSKTRATFGKVNDGDYKFFGIYEFIGVQTVDYEKIIRNGSYSSYNVKDKYIGVFKRTQTELKISEWTR